jgi:hypothetical protein
MSLFGRFKSALTPKPYPLVEFGMGNMRFFVALLRACPEGSRITFDQSEPESFVHAFGKWSYREDPNSFEADYYTIDGEFIALAEERARRGELELYCHFGISSPEGELLCTSWDDFMVVKLTKELEEKIRTETKSGSDQDPA